MNFIIRHALLIALAILALLMLSPARAEINTFLLIAAVECIALALSGVAVFVFTRINFTSEYAGNNLGLIFLGVHVCAGMSVLGVYIAQFAN